MQRSTTTVAWEKREKKFIPLMKCSRICWRLSLLLIFLGGIINCDTTLWHCFLKQKNFSVKKIESHRWPALWSFFWIDVRNMFVGQRQSGKLYALQMNDFMRVHFVVTTSLCDLHDDLMLFQFIREIKVWKGVWKEKVVELYDWFYIEQQFFFTSQGEKSYSTLNSSYKIAT